jgi:hypothetical protein
VLHVTQTSVCTNSRAEFATCGMIEIVRSARFEIVGILEGGVCAACACLECSTLILIWSVLMHIADVVLPVYHMAVSYRSQWGRSSIRDPTVDIANLEREIDELESKPAVNTPIRPVVQQLARVLQNVHSREPFEADTIYLHVSQISEALQTLLMRQAGKNAIRQKLLQRFAHRFFVELVCRQPQDTWPPSLVAVLVDLAFGTTDRLDRGVLTPSLQKALLHRVFQDEHEQSFTETVVATAANLSIEARLLLVQYFEDR